MTIKIFFGIFFLGLSFLIFIGLSIVSLIRLYFKNKYYYENVGLQTKIEMLKETRIKFNGDDRFDPESIKININI